MDELRKITIKDVEEKLVGENLKINRIISSVLWLGPLFFLFVILFLYQNNSSLDVNVKQDSVVELMSLILPFFALVVYSIFFLLPKIYLKKDGLKLKLSSPSLSSRTATNPAVDIIMLDRTLMVVRLAMLEGIALFGLVILILSVSDGTIYDNSNYWLLIIPLLVLIIVAVTQYLSKDKILSRIENDILSKIREL